MELILEITDTMSQEPAVHLRFHRYGDALRAALHEHGVLAPDVHVHMRSPWCGIGPGDFRNDGEAVFAQVHGGPESRIVVPQDGGGPQFAFQGKDFFQIGAFALQNGV